jgi:glycosyltransferase involved in cell wall biosynthesis
MRIFIGCTEICGMIGIYANELRRQGHEVTTCVHAKHRFFAGTDYNIVANFWADYLAGRDTNKPYGVQPGFLDKVALKLRSVTPLFDGLISKKIFDQHDVFIFLWAGDYLMRNGKDLEVLHRKGKKVISIFVGSDVRYPQAFEQEFRGNTSEWPANYKKPYSYYNQIVRQAELYSDVIFSVPDQSSIAIRPYHHFPIPLELEKYKFQWSDRDIPVVVHAPSAPALKGTDIILATLERLKQEGVNFELKFIQNMENPELVKLLSESDILVDELILNGPGGLSIEAMACGCAVATHYYLDSPDSFRPPVCPIDKTNVYEVVKKLILDKAYRKELAYAGRSYVEQNNEVSIVVSEIFGKLSKGDKAAVYTPVFFRDHFILPHHEKAGSVDKELTRKVAEKYLVDYDLHKSYLEQRGLI